MNYYEELGIKPDADVDEIRKAHRRLVKLMHPDQQRDPSLKQLAETQMRRLNSIVSTLLDPGQREEYDDDLREQQIVRPDTLKAWRSIPWWIASTAGAVVLTVGAVWIWADHLGSSFSHGPVSIPPQAEQAVNARKAPEVAPQASVQAKPEPVTRPAVLQDPKGDASNEEASKRTADATPAAETIIDPPKQAPLNHAQPSVGQPNVAQLNQAQSNQAQSNQAQSNQAKPADAKIVRRVPAPVVASARASEQKKFNLPPGLQPAAASRLVAADALPPAPGLSSSNGSTHEESASLVMPALPAALAPRPDVPKADLRTPTATVTSASGFETLAGEWVYAPKEPEKRKPGFYPPEFISLRLADNDGALHGQYNARYEVAGNKPTISPEVSFQVRATDKSAHKFEWHSSNGSRGTLAIHAIDGRTIRLEWRTTVFSGGPALTSGIATLVRRTSN